MSILDAMGYTKSVTEGTQAFDAFTDRLDAIHVFAGYLNDDPPRDTILFFHGEGGNGKSLLLNFLRRTCCKRFLPDNWAFVKAATGDDFKTHVAETEGVRPIPIAWLDFGEQPHGATSPRQDLSALLHLRRQLAEHHLAFPSFEFACLWYMSQNNYPTDEIKRYFRPKEAAYVMAVVTAIATGSVIQGTLGAMASVVFGALTQPIVDLYGRLIARMTLDKTQIEYILSLDPERQLRDELPALFARDLNAAIAETGAPERVVLFFDTIEEFWGQVHRLSRHDLFERDRWLRRLLGELHLSAGIVAVIAGQTLPVWADAPSVRIPDEFLDPHRVDGFSDADAAHYLGAVGITDAALQRSLIASAAIAPDHIHPLYLGLCVDVVALAAHRGQHLSPNDVTLDLRQSDRGTALIERLLRYADQDMRHAIIALCACRSFDEDLFYVLGSRLHFDVTRASFEALVHLSFVWSTASHGGGRYRIHDLLRRLVEDHYPEQTRHAHEVLAQHYHDAAEAGDILALSESIYHRNRLDWAQGVQEWIAALEHGAKGHRVDLCRALLDVRTALTIETDFWRGRVLHTEADFLRTLYRDEDAAELLVEAEAAFDRALSGAPTDDRVIEGKSGVLLSRAAICTELGQYKEALDACHVALDILDTTLRMHDDEPTLHNNRAGSLQQIAEVQAAKGQHESAIATLNDAIAAYDRAMIPDRRLVHILTNKGMAQRRRATAAMQLARYDDAIADFEAAADTFAEAMERDSGYLDAYNGFGCTLTEAGAMYIRVGEFTEAARVLQQATTMFTEVLGVASDSVITLANSAIALQNLGDALGLNAQYDDDASRRVDALKRARDLYDQALARLEVVLSHASTNAHTLAEAAGVAMVRGDVLALLGEPDQAVASFDKALRLIEAARGRAPDNTTIRLREANVLLRRAIFEAKRKDYEAALAAGTKSLVCVDTVRAGERDNPDVYLARGLTLQTMGEAAAWAGHYRAAAANYNSADRAFKRLITLAPSNVRARVKKSQVLASLAVVYRQMGPRYRIASINALRGALGEAGRAVALAGHDREAVATSRHVRELAEKLLKE